MCMSVCVHVCVSVCVCVCKLVELENLILSEILISECTVLLKEGQPWHIFLETLPKIIISLGRVEQS